MAKLGSLKRIFKQDFEAQYQNLIDQLGTLVNTSLEQLFNALNKGLTFTDNFASTVKDLEIIVDSNGIPTTSVSFPVDFATPALGCLALNISPPSPNVYLTSGVSILYTQNNKQIIIRQVTGLTPNVKYLIKIIVFAS